MRQRIKTNLVCKFPISILLFCIFVLLSCATTGPGGKKSFIIIPSGQEIAIGSGMAEEVEKTEKILDDLLWQSYINDIGQRIVAVSDRKDIKYQFKVIDSDQLNAFAAPGGFIYFYTGLIKEMDNEAELASVVAHEVSHVVGRHGIKRLQTALGVALAYEIVFGDDQGALIAGAVNVGMGLLFAGYSRDNERESDEFGFHYMIKAGYDPNAMVSMFNILAEKGGGGQNSFEKLVSSHPETIERISNTKSRIAESQPLPNNLTLKRAKFQKMLERLPKK